jgi:uncharacterized ferritin-like protein (DUF455 family)
MRAAFVSGIVHSVTGLSSSASALAKPQLLLHLSSRRPLVVSTSSSPRRGSTRFPRMLHSSFSPPAQSASTKDSVPGHAEQPDTLRSLAEYGRRVLCSPDPAEKIRLTNAAAKFWASPDTRAIGAPLGSAVVPATPARPELPRIVGSGEMPTAKDAVASGFSRPVYLLHALAHVELNAIDLAWDTALRFGEGMNKTWFDDFLSIAVDESRHFGWLSARLEALGSSYGAMPAHRIVWDAADCSKTSRKERLAVGQLCQEARGLDAGPKLAERLTGMGDLESAAIVKKIAEEEVAHVSIGGKSQFYTSFTSSSRPFVPTLDAALTEAAELLLSVRCR